MNRSKLAASLLFAAGIAFGGCDRESCDREEPVLRFDSYEYNIFQLEENLVIDSLIVKVAFEDCQGDIGIKQGESGFNLQTFQFEMIDSVWTRVEPQNAADTLAFFAKVPFSSETNDGNKLEGTIEQRFGSVKQKSDTIRFEVRLIDRAGNQSEKIVTPTFILQDY